MTTAEFIPTSTQGVMRTLDGTAVPLVHTQAFGKGDFKSGNLMQILNTPVWMESRGHLVGYGLGGREYPSGSFSAWLPKLVNAAAGSVGDMVMGTGLYAARLSTLSTSGAGKIPVTLDLHMHWEGTDQGGTDSDLYFEDCLIKIDSLEESTDGCSIAFSWECKGKVRNGTSRAAPVYASEVA